MTTNLSDDVNFLHAFYLKFIINASIIYIPVKATFSMSIVWANITVNILIGILLCLLCANSDPSWAV